MKVIHIAGWSGSGKTTFILDLVTALTPLGRVGTIKHIGDHICDLPAGKDTSLHYDAGACLSSGIDLEKTMITCRTVSLSVSLDVLSDAGVKYAVVEGFKKIRFKMAVQGELDTPALIYNPAVHEVIALLPSFDDYYTPGGLAQEIGESDEGVFSMVTGVAPPDLSPATCHLLEDEAGSWDGVSGIRIRVQKPIIHDRPRVFVVVRADSGLIGSTVLSRCVVALGI